MVITKHNQLSFPQILFRILGFCTLFLFCQTKANEFVYFDTKDAGKPDENTPVIQLFFKTRLCVTRSVIIVISDAVLYQHIKDIPGRADSTHAVAITSASSYDSIL
jgi:hypothetical protein